METKKPLEGYRTLIGIGLTVLGLLGYGDLISAEQVGDVINGLTTLVGIAYSIYGNIQAHRKIGALQAKLGALSGFRAELL